MTRIAVNALLPLVQSFFTEYLRCVRGASEHTVRAYRDALRMFFVFLAARSGRPIAALRLDDIRADDVLAFLHNIESTRRNSASTRNCRLAAIRSFADHLLRHDVTRAEQYGRILAIPTKRAVNRLVTYLEPEEMRAVIAAIDRRNTRMNVRDRALLLLLYNTGARISEALAVRPRDLHLEKPRQVRLYGKGGKERMSPLWSETAAAIRVLAMDRAAGDVLFRSASGSPLTRDGAAYVIRRHVSRAAESLPALRRRRVTPHVIRHSCAVALLQAGVDITVIRDYLGHASIATTSRYLTTNLEMKRKVLKAFWERAGLEHRSSTRWRPSSKLLEFLSSL